MNLDNNQKGILAFVAMFILALILLLVVRAHAHDIARPDLDSWFSQLKSGKGYCCSNGDGTALSDVDWDVTGGHYRVRIDGEWISVPDEAVITEPNLAGIRARRRAHQLNRVVLVAGKARDQRDLRLGFEKALAALPSRVRVSP